MPEMQRMVEAMLRSLRGIAAISWLLVIVMYVFSVMGTMLFGDGGVAGEMYFGNLGLSLYSLFQIMTLESWSNGIARMIIDEQGWWAAIFFVTYIISTSFTFLNMFIAVFTNTMAAIDVEDEGGHEIAKVLRELQLEIADLKGMIEGSGVDHDERGAITIQQQRFDVHMEPPARIELATSSLPMRCYTAKPRWQ